MLINASHRSRFVELHGIKMHGVTKTEYQAKRTASHLRERAGGRVGGSGRVARAQVKQVAKRAADGWRSLREVLGFGGCSLAPLARVRRALDLRPLGPAADVHHAAALLVVLSHHRLRAHLEGGPPEV